MVVVYSDSSTESEEIVPDVNSDDNNVIVTESPMKNVLKLKVKKKNEFGNVIIYVIYSKRWRF